MSAGLSAVIGAVVGGGASLAGTVFAQRSQRIRDAETRQRELRERSLTAARIVLSDLAWARRRVTEALRSNKKKYWSEQYEPTDTAWTEYRETLALCLDSAADWWTVQEAFRAIRTLRLQSGRRRRVDDRDSRPAMSPWGVEQAEKSLHRIDAGIKLLEPLAGKAEDEDLILEESESGG